MLRAALLLSEVTKEHRGIGLLYKGKGRALPNVVAIAQHHVLVECTLHSTQDTRGESLGSESGGKDSQLAAKVSNTPRIPLNPEAVVKDSSLPANKDVAVSAHHPSRDDKEREFRESRGSRKDRTTSDVAMLGRTFQSRAAQQDADSRRR